MAAISSSDTPVDGLTHFFETIWKDKSGFVYLPTLDRKSSTWKKQMFKWPEHKIHVVNHVLGNTAQGLDVYYAPVLFDRAKEPKPLKENVLGSYVCWAEYDGSAPQEWTPETATITEGTLAAPVPPPTLRVQSSKEGNEHCYWELNVFSTDIGWIENTNRSITYATRADTSGWDINQVLRPPYTRNYKYPDSPSVTVSHQSRNTYSTERFSLLKPVKQLVIDAVNTEDLPTVEAVIAKYPWDTETFKFFMDPSIPEGKRSAALMRLGYVCAEMGMGDTEVYAILDNADARWGKYVGRSDRKVRLLDILNRARTKHPNAIANLTFAGLSGTSEVEEGLQYIYGMQEFLDSSIEVEWAINDFLEVGGMGIIASAPGVGKTQVSIQLGIACALGTNFLGWQPARPMRITLLSLEMSHVALKKFMQTIAGAYTEDEIKLLDENLKIIPLGEMLDLNRELPKAFLYSLLEQTKPDGLIIDSLKKLTSKALDEEVVTGINNHLGILRKKFGCFVWLIHHNRKQNGDNKRPDSLDDIYGSTYITAEVTAALLLYRDRATKQLTVYNVKNRLHEERDPFNVVRDANLFFTETDTYEPVGEGLLKKAESRGVFDM